MSGHVKVVCYMGDVTKVDLTVDDDCKAFIDYWNNKYTTLYTYEITFHNILPHQLFNFNKKFSNRNETNSN